MHISDLGQWVLFRLFFRLSRQTENTSIGRGGLRGVQKILILIE